MFLWIGTNGLIRLMKKLKIEYNGIQGKSMVSVTIFGDSDDQLVDVFPDSDQQTNKVQPAADDQPTPESKLVSVLLLFLNFFILKCKLYFLMSIPSYIIEKVDFGLLVISILQIVGICHGT